MATAVSHHHVATAVAAAKAVHDGRTTVEAVVRACAERAEAGERDLELRAWAHLDAAAALREALALDSAAAAAAAADSLQSTPAPSLPLRGVVLGVKDIIDTADMPTAYGSPALYAGHVPARDAACVALARSAGAVVLGKTASTEFAYYAAAATRNPRAAAAGKRTPHTPGGSSSGSAAAVAAGVVPAALGTQTAGSIVRPAAFCGCVGFKPSFGLLDVTGVRPLAVSLDTLGVLAGCVADAALVVAVLAGRPELRVDDDDGSVGDGSGGGNQAQRRELLRRPPAIGLYRPPEWEEAEPAARERVEETARRLAVGGCTVTDMVLPDVFERLGAAQKAVMAYESARSNHAEVRTSAEKVSPQMRALVETGRRTSPAAYDAARALATEGLTAFTTAMDGDGSGGLDVVLTLAAPGEAPAGLESTGDPVFNRVWTLLGVPALSLPAGVGPGGLPLAVQLIGRRGGDARLLAHAHWIEQALRQGLGTSV
ncbi:hypothetical protein HK405_004420 [Cladochytrium tenue]|nr:hypothetical protein HK405_004420 [Cladochytrium tenue]